MKKDWLKLCFFPIENIEDLATLRKMMTPFMKNICRCYEIKTIDREEKERICGEIIKTASTYVNSELKSKLDHLITHQIDSKNNLKLQQRNLENISLR